MSDQIKYGETYESLAKNISPYLTKTSYKSPYPAWWADTITVYSKYENPITDMITWYRYKIDNCFMQQNSSVLMGNQVQYNTNNIVVRIPQQDNFKPYAEWINVPNAEMPNYFTINTGSIVIQGDIEDTIDEYTTGKRSTDLLNKYKGLVQCITVTSFSDNTGVGRVLPHYRVMGD